MLEMLNSQIWVNCFYGVQNMTWLLATVSFCLFCTGCAVDTICLSKDLKMDDFIKHLYKIKDIKWLMILLCFLCPCIVCLLAQLLWKKSYSFLVDVLQGFWVIVPLCVYKLPKTVAVFFEFGRSLRWQVFDVGKFVASRVRSGKCDTDVVVC